VKVNYKCLEKVAKLKYLRIAVTNGNYRCEDIKSRLNFGEYLRSFKPEFLIMF
jgi:hypothetical protein